MAIKDAEKRPADPAQMRELGFLYCGVGRGTPTLAGFQSR